ncbi:hypothetical protein B0A50_07633 [Salinomyces thailandicus]|uniref:SANT domain-containing protein n=1 Tax=Salinomyces thailandicus TaxID=706561 RepID=A0A4U0TL69_9PEZI|nr:hypothetical protein B0A50_07633 [Salinomyces thailandica]
MSGIISSAVAGKAAAPKAPARRRPAPSKPTPASTQASQAPTVEPAVLPTPSATQQSTPSRDQPHQEEPVQSQPQTVVPTITETRPEHPQPASAKEHPGTGHLTPVEASDHAPQQPRRPPPVGELEYQLNDIARPQSPVETRTTGPKPLPLPQRAPVIQHVSENDAASSAPATQATKEATVAPLAPTTSAQQTRKRKSVGEQRQAKPATKRQKKSSARSNAAVQAQARGEDAAIPSPEVPLPVEPGAANEDGIDAEDALAAATSGRPKRKRQTTKKKSAVTVTEDTPEPGEDEEEATGGEDNATPKPRRRRRTTKKKSASRKPRGQTTGPPADGEEQADPSEDDGSDPEAHVHDSTTMSMWEVSRDGRHGKVSDREKKMAEIDWEEVDRKRYEEYEKIANGQRQEEEAREKEAKEEKARKEKEKEKEKALEENGESEEGDEEGGKKKRRRGKGKSNGKGKKDKQGRKKGTEQQGVVKSTEGADGLADDAEDDDAAEQDAHAGATLEDDTDAGDGGNDAEEEGEANEEADEAETAAAPPLQAGTVSGPQIRLVNGEMVLDDDANDDANAHPATARNENGELVEIEEENDLTIRLNRATWVNNRRRDPKERLPAWKTKSDPWGEEETDRFYDALRMFGTDFYVISKMFHPKTRKQIKLKFNREEKLDPQRITKALLGQETRTMSLNHYAQETGIDIEHYTKYDSYAHADQVIRESMKDKEAAMHAAMAEEQENVRQAGIAEKQKAEAKKAMEEKRAVKKARGGKKMGAGTLGG